MQEDSSGKIRERTSIYSSPAGRYVTGPERCPANIRMRLFTLLPLGVIKNYRDRPSVAAPISAMQRVVVLCMKITSVCVAPCSPRLPYLRITRSRSRRAQTDFGRKACPVIQIDTEVRVLNPSSFNLA